MQFRCVVALALLASAEASQAGHVQDVVASLKALPPCYRVYAVDPTDKMDLVGSGIDEPHKMIGHFQGIARGYNSSCIYISASASDSSSGISSGDVFSVMFADASSDGALANMEGTTVAKVQVHETQWHAGGISTFDDILVVGTEGTCSADLFAAGACDSIIHFFELDDNTCELTRLDYTIVREGDHASKGITAGAVALTSLASGKFLLAVGEWGNDPVRFYLSTREDREDMREDPEFIQVAVLEKADVEISGEARGNSYGGYQNIDLLRQADGKVYMLATHAMGNVVSGYAGFGSDYVDIFEIPMDDDVPTGMKMVFRKQMSCSGGTNFRNGAGIFVPGGGSDKELVVYSVDRNTAGPGVFLNEYWAPPCEKFTGGTCSLSACDESRNAVCNRVGIDECYCAEDMCAENGACVVPEFAVKKCKKPQSWPQGYTPAFCTNDAETCSVRDLMTYNVSCTLDSFGHAALYCHEDGGTFQISGCAQLDSESCEQTNTDGVECNAGECAVLNLCIDVSREPTCDIMSQSDAQVPCPTNRARLSNASVVAVGSCMSKTVKEEYDACMADLCCDEAVQELDAAVGMSLFSFTKIAYVLYALHACSRFTL